MSRHLDFLSELAMLAWTVKGDEAKGAVQTITGLQVIVGVWNRITKQDDIDLLRENTLLSIADYVNKNPRASEDAIRNEVSRQIELFASRVALL